MQKLQKHSGMMKRPLVSLAVLALVATAIARQPEKHPYTNLSPPQYETIIEYEVKVPMRDGVRLAANIVRPKAPGRFPAVISYVPYGKDPNPFFAQRGYVTVFAEGRGTGTSEGVMADYFLEQASQDGYDLVEWVARQPWCDGNVGLWGGSYGAINATRIAALGPPHLKAIAVNSSYANFFGDHWYPGGVRTNHPYAWHGVMNLLATMLRGPIYDDGKGGKRVALDLWKRHIAENGWRNFFRSQWEHTSYDEYWKEKDLRSKYASFAVPTLQFGNYFDHARNHDECYQNYLVLKAKQVPQKLIVGPWDHGGGGAKYVLNYQLITLAWFDRFLKGIDTGITREPPVTIFVMRQNRWRFEQDWPIARTRFTKFYLTRAGTLTLKGPNRPGSLRFTYRPWVGSAAGPYGTWFDFKYDDYLVQPDQRVDEAESLTFTSDELAQDLEVTGMAEINFYAASSADNTDFTVKLSDVLPNGKSELVTRGWVNSSYRESNLNPRRPEEWKFVPPSPIAPGKVYRYRFTLQNISYLFKKGHRIRVTIASSDWPSNWPNPKPAENEIYFASPDQRDASYILLPVIPKQEPALPEPQLPERPTPPSPPAPPPYTIWIEKNLRQSTISYNFANRVERPIPGGTFHDVREWKILLRQEPPYEQTITVVTNWTLLRPGAEDVRFVYRFRCDHSGPQVVVELNGEKVP
jgi:hypothetical protein